MCNRMCDHWLKLGSTEYDVFLVESLKFSNISLHRCLSLVSLLNRVRLLASMIVLVLALACWMETREHTRARAQTCIKSVPYIYKHCCIYLCVKYCDCHC